MEKHIATINKVQLLVIDDKIEKFVPIKPICEALGINYTTQIDKIKDDSFLSSNIVLRGTVAADNKTREMSCLPYRFIFGWLFTINPKNVAPEAKDAVEKYRIECYEALFKHFTELSDFLYFKNQNIEKQLEVVEAINKEFSTAKKKLSEEKEKLNEIRTLSIDKWRMINAQTTIQFDDYQIVK